MDDLASGLTNLAELDRITFRCRLAEFLCELTAGREVRVLARGVSGTSPTSSAEPLVSSSPFGMDQTPASFFAKKGPPGCTASTSMPSLTGR